MLNFRKRILVVPFFGAALNLRVLAQNILDAYMVRLGNRPEGIRRVGKNDAYRILARQNHLLRTPYIYAHRHPYFLKYTN